MRAMRLSITSGAALAQVGHLAPADDLHPVRVDVVEVADQVGGERASRIGGFVEAALGVAWPATHSQRRRRGVASNSASALMEVGFMLEARALTRRI